MKKGTKTMARTKNRLKKMNFQKQSRAKSFEYEPLSDNDKYIIRLAGYRKELRNRTTNENISRLARGGLRPQHI